MTRMRTTAFAASVAAVLGIATVGATVLPHAAEAQNIEYRVEFALDSASLDDQAMGVVRQAAQDFQSGNSASIRLVGHTDTTASEEYNLRLSEQRAAAVRDALVDEGVSAGAISTEAVGEFELIVPTAEGVPLQANRVVTIALIDPPAPQPVAETPAPVQEEETDTFRNFAIDLGPYYGFDRGPDHHLVGANLSIDYRINEYLSLGTEQAGFWVIEDGVGGRSVASIDFSVGSLADLGGFGQVIPYVGANAGYVYGLDIDNDFIYGPEIGIDLGYVTAKVAYDIRSEGFDEGIISATIGGLIRF